MTATTLFSSSAGDIPANLAFKNNYAGTAAPTTNNDISQGYTAGSTWIYSGAVYTCTSSAVGAAVWAKQQTQTNGGDVSVTGNLYIAGEIFGTQGAPAAKTVSGTLSAADILNGIITVAQGASGNSAQTLPTGAVMQAGLPTSFGVNNYIDFSIANISTTSGETATLTAAASGFTIVGNAVVAINSSATFRVRKTADSTFVAYRIAG